MRKLDGLTVLERNISVIFSSMKAPAIENTIPIDIVSIPMNSNICSSGRLKENISKYTRIFWIYKYCLEFNKGTQLHDFVRSFKCQIR